jgi:hypothetical protein
MEWYSLKKKRPILSLSRTRTKKQKTETSCQTILQNNSAAVKQESVECAVQTQSSLDNVMEQFKISLSPKSVTPEIKTESSSLNLRYITMESQPLYQEKLMGELNLEVPLSVSKSVDVSKNNVKEEDEVEFKKEEEDMHLIKEEEEEVEAWLSSIDPEQTVTDATIDSDEYHCPICNVQLGSSSTLRQNHIEKCLEGGQEEREEREDLEFSQCFICSKDLGRFSAEQREAHLNRCLDLKQAEEKKKKDSTFAGQSIPYIDVLDDCPVCHLPFKSKVLTHKISHLKKCSRKNNISAELLKQKCRWIEWGHTPLAAADASDTNDKSSKRTILSHFYATDMHDDDAFGEYDDDFSDRVIVHRAVSTKAIERRMDQQDEELQAALAMSLSLQVKKPKKRVFEPDAADIWTPEESKCKSLERLTQLSLEKKPLPLFNISFKPTRFTTHSPSFWKLASLKVESTYSSLFIQELHNKVKL